MTIASTTRLIKPRKNELLTRRKLITGIAALSAMRVLGDGAEAQTLNGGSAGPDLAPAQAAAVGYNNRTFYDDFTSTSTIDLKDTRAAGFNWYVHNAWPSSPPAQFIRTLAPTPSSCFSQSGSILNCGAPIPAGNPGTFLSTACADPTDSTHYIGKVFNNGFYAECSMAIGRNSGGGGTPCPAFWTWPIEMACGTFYPYVEIDVMEHTAAGASNDMNFDAYEWSAVPPRTVHGNRDVHTLAGSLSDQHIYGCLNVPMAQNRGTGYLKYFYDNNIVTSFFYSAAALPNPIFDGAVNGSLSEIDIAHYFLTFGWQNAGTIAIDWVKVWQL